MKSQRRIALVWGRKFFFSYGLLSLMAVGLLFFQHLSRPDSTLSMVYLATSFLGHFGLMITLAYFVFYVPLVWISPGYYWSRFWAASIITALVSVVALDAIVVSQFRWHFYELFSFKHNLSFDDILTVAGIKTVFLVTAAIFWIFLFIIGEKLWRHLQRKFSQTTSNWYLYPILGSFFFAMIVHIVADYKGNQNLIAYDDTFAFQVTPTAKKIFSKLGFANEQSTKKDFGHQSFFYPKGKIKCDVTKAKNLVVILVPNWTESQLMSEEESSLLHYASHGQRFALNYVGTENKQEGIFSFFYGLPPFYENGFVSNKIPSVFLETLSHGHITSELLASSDGAEFLSEQIPFSKFESNEALLLGFKNKLSATTEETPFALFNYVRHTDHAEVESAVRSIIEEVVTQKKMKTTNIVIASISSSETKAPLITLFSNREDQVVNHFSQLVDVVPSLMRDQFKCKNSFNDYSLGSNLWENQKRKIMFSGLQENLEILSFDDAKGALTELESQAYLQELKFLSFFYKRSR